MPIKFAVNFLVFFLFFINSALTESINLGHSAIINVPEGMGYYSYNAKKQFLENATRRSESKQKIKLMLDMITKSGWTDKDLNYEITSLKEIEFIEREKDLLSRAENDIAISKFVEEQGCNKKTNSAYKNCVFLSYKLYVDAVQSFTVGLPGNEAETFKKLNNMSDKQIEELSDKEIKLLRKEYASKIKNRSDSGRFSEKGTRNIKITSDANFYVENRSIVKQDGVEIVYVSYVLPFKNREFFIQGYCIKQYCEGIEEKMQEIIRPIFKIDTSGLTTYDFYKQEEMQKLISTVRNGYRIYSFAKYLLVLL